MAQRLSSDTLKCLALRKDSGIEIPTYDRSALKPGHIHFGFGKFFPAFAAYKTHQLLQAGDKDAYNYGIVAVNTNHTDRSAQLNPQDGLYTVVELDREGKNNLTIVGSVIKFLFAPNDPEAIYNLIASPETRLVSLTIMPQTHASYRDTNGNLNLDHPDIRNDLDKDNIPRTVMGFILRGLLRRGDNPGFTVMNLDNLAGNGDLFRLLFRQFATAYDPFLTTMVDAKLRFPNSMVDRIVPKTTPELVKNVADRLGLEDSAPVPAEPMPRVSWVLEGDTVANGRPAWERSRLVHHVSDASPYELMKLRLLNGSFFGICQLADLKGLKYVYEAVTDPSIKRFMISQMNHESIPTLKPVPDVDLEAYTKEVVERLSNTALQDTVVRIVRDGALTNHLNALRDQMRLGIPIDLRTLSIAAWMRRCRVDQNEVGGNIDFAYPSADMLRAKAKEGGNDPRALLSVTQLFGDMGTRSQFVETLGEYLVLLDQRSGVDVAIQAAIEASNKTIVNK